MNQIFYYPLIDFSSKRHPIGIRMIGRYDEPGILQHLQSHLYFCRTILPFYPTVNKLGSCLMRYAYESLAQKQRICLSSVFGKIVLIALNDFVYNVTTIAIRSCLRVGCHGFWHSANQHITSEGFHQPIIECLGKRIRRTAISLDSKKTLLSRCCQEFIKRHRIDKQGTNSAHSK